MTVEQGDGAATVVRKVAPPGERADQLAREAGALRRGRHPGVVEVLATVEGDDGSRELVTRFAGTHTLATWAPPTFDEAAGFLVAVAETVAELHHLGIVHGGLAPEHVIVAADGHPVLCGFDRSAEHRPADDIAALGRLVRSVLDPDPSTSRGAPHTDRRRAGSRRRVLELADHATGLVEQHRPSARRLAAAILAAAPTATPPLPSPEPARPSGHPIATPDPHHDDTTPDQRRARTDTTPPSESDEPDRPAGPDTHPPTEPPSAPPRREPADADPTPPPLDEVEHRAGDGRAARPGPGDGRGRAGRSPRTDGRGRPASADRLALDAVAGSGWDADDASTGVTIGAGRRERIRPGRRDTPGRGGLAALAVVGAVTLVVGGLTAWQGERPALTSTPIATPAPTATVPGGSITTPAPTEATPGGATTAPIPDGAGDPCVAGHPCPGGVPCPAAASCPQRASGPSCPTGGSCSSVVPGGPFVHHGRRYELGSPTDVLVLAGESCPDAPVAGVLREDGSTFFVDRWAEPGAEVVARPGPVLAAGSTWLAQPLDTRGCAPAVARHPDGATIVVTAPPAEPDPHEHGGSR